LKPKILLLFLTLRTKGGLVFLIAVHMDGPERLRFPQDGLLEIPPAFARCSVGVVTMTVPLLFPAAMNLISECRERWLLCAIAPLVRR
jgi:hypothetical protein